MSTIYKSALAAALFFVTACGHRAGGGAVGVTGEPAAAAAPANEVKVVRNGKVLTSYSSRGAAAALVEGELMVALNSPDLKHTLVIYANGSKAGTYPLAEGEDPGEAWMHFMSDQLPTPAFDAQGGELKITELSGQHCSGTLKATRTESNGDAYSVEATFNRLSVRPRGQ